MKLLARVPASICILAIVSQLTGCGTVKRDIANTTGGGGSTNNAFTVVYNTETVSNYNVCIKATSPAIQENASYQANKAICTEEAIAIQGFICGAVATIAFLPGCPSVDTSVPCITAAIIAGGENGWTFAPKEGGGCDIKPGGVEECTNDCISLK